jgi:hypothetical protein
MARTPGLCYIILYQNVQCDWLCQRQQEKFPLYLTTSWEEMEIKHQVSYASNLVEGKRLRLCFRCLTSAESCRYSLERRLDGLHCFTGHWLLVICITGSITCKYIHNFVHFLKHIFKDLKNLPSHNPMSECSQDRYRAHHCKKRKYCIIFSNSFPIQVV